MRVILNAAIFEFIETDDIIFLLINYEVYITNGGFVKHVERT